jgi:hypothetical protein
VNPTSVARGRSPQRILLETGLLWRRIVGKQSRLWPDASETGLPGSAVERARCLPPLGNGHRKPRRDRQLLSRGVNSQPSSCSTMLAACSAVIEQIGTQEASPRSP